MFPFVLGVCEGNLFQVTAAPKRGAGQQFGLLFAQRVSDLCSECEAAE